MLESMNQEKRLEFGNDRQLNQKRQVKLKTCADVYDHWRSYKRLYKKAPNDGIEFQIDYIDTGLALDEAERSRAPIALALHGAPGSYHDFSLLISHLTRQKVRVIAPNFPEYIATVKTKVLFRHSADEKAAYLRDFLKAINVNKIDLLVSHSSAIFPTLLILLNANNEALARQRQRNEANERQRVDQDERKRAQKRTNTRTTKSNNQLDGRVVSVESFSEIGNQLRGNVVELVDKDNGTMEPDAAEQRQHNDDKDNRTHDDYQAPRGLSGAMESENDDDEHNETFEDATDELDGNNNQRNIDISTEQHINNGHNQADDANQNGFGAVVADKPAKRHRRSAPASGRQPNAVVKFDEPIEIKAVALFNPAGHRLPKSMKPTWFKCGSVHIYQHKLGRSLFRKFGPAFLTVVGVPVRVDNMDNVMLSATVMRNSKCQRVVRQLEQLSQMKIPTLLVFSENDKLIEKEIFYEMTQFMRLDSKNFDVFNNDGDIELSQSRMDDWIRVMVFKAGGHYAYSNYAKTVNNAVSALLNKVTSTKCSN